jgi:hypothetical protein
VSRYLLSRTLACVVLAFFAAIIFHADHVKWSAAGMQAFLSYQQTRYIKHIATPTSAFTFFLGSLLVCILAAGFYELCVFTFSTVAARVMPRD